MCQSTQPAIRMYYLTSYIAVILLSAACCGKRLPHATDPPRDAHTRLLMWPQELLAASRESTSWQWVVRTAKKKVATARKGKARGTRRSKRSRRKSRRRRRRNQSKKINRRRRNAKKSKSKRRRRKKPPPTRKSRSKARGSRKRKKKHSIIRKRKLARCGPRLPSASRIVGGQLAASAASYNAALYSGHKRCSGSVVGREWVLSAAHCRLVVGDVVVVGGAHAGRGGRRRVVGVHRHPNYRRNKRAVMCDLMLVRLNAPVGSAARPIALNANAWAPRAGRVVRATGYGRDTHNRRGRLRAVDVDALALGTCQTAFRRARLGALAAGLRRTHHICANHRTCDIGVCFGDSGGPLVARHRWGIVVQIGVTSYGGPRCGSRAAPDVYARVAFHRRWIWRVTRGGVKFVWLRP